MVLCSFAVPLRTSLSVQMVEGLPAPFPPLPAGIPLRVGEGAGGTGHCAPHLGGPQTQCVSQDWLHPGIGFYLFFISIFTARRSLCLAQGLSLVFALRFSQFHGAEAIDGRLGWDLGPPAAWL